jgi:hypothetical protein
LGLRSIAQRWRLVGPLSGSALNVTLFSYDGTCSIGIASDRAAVRDPETLVACLEQGIAEVLAVCWARAGYFTPGSPFFAPPGAREVRSRDTDLGRPPPTRVGV